MTTPSVPVTHTLPPRTDLSAVEATVTAQAIQRPDGGWTVEAKFVTDTEVDRPGGYPWSLRPRDAALAARLVRACEAGVVFSDFRMGTDINGKTYLTAWNNISTRTMNADLARLGY